MRDLVLTGYTGDEHGRMAELTVPLMERYARRHGASFGVADLREEDGVTPPSWVKVKAIGEQLSQYDRVLWLDADVVVVQSGENIFDALPPGGEAVQAVVEHHTECGHVPNCGVWLVGKAMMTTLLFVWQMRRGAYLSHPWWEQAAIMELMGYSVYLRDGGARSEVVRSSPLRERTVYLPPKWNHHPADVNKLDSPNFVHVTMYSDRVSEIRRLCDFAT